MPLLLRALVAFLALPGVVAFVLPLLLARSMPVYLGVGAVLALVAGVSSLLWCTWEFYARGRGTLAPWSPPAELVTTGLYRFTRNPMYLAVLLVLAGWVLLFRSQVLALYMIGVALAFHFRVVHGEEPALARAHGERWHTYAKSAPRWLWQRSRTSDDA